MKYVDDLIIKYINKLKENNEDVYIKMNMISHDLYDTYEDSHGKNRSHKCHTEGSIWTHTALTLQSFRYESEQVNLSEKDCETVIITLLLHDIGKVACKSIDEEGKVRFSDHEYLSSLDAISILSGWDIPDEHACEIVKLINVHDEIFNIVRSDMSDDKKNKRISCIFRQFPLLIYIMECDRKGRFSEKDEDFSYVRDIYNNINNTKHEEKNYEHEILILCGLPGSGKSTFKNQEKYSDYVTISWDNWVYKYAEQNNMTFNESFNYMIETGINLECKKENERLFYEAMANGKNVIVDLTMLTRKSRKPFFDVKPGYVTNCICFLDGYDRLNDINIKRASEDRTIPDDVYKSMILKFSYPLYMEGFNNISYMYKRKMIK